MYNGFAIIPDLRQTDIRKTWPLLDKKFPCDFFHYALLISLQKELDSYLLWFFYNRSQTYRDILKKYRKGAITL